MAGRAASGLNILSLEPRIKILHFTWIAFFISFLVWFAHAPLLVAIRDSLGLTDQQVKTLLILNVALTIPARIIMGMLVDKLGPKITYAALLAISSGLCFAFALADDFATLALTRFLLGFVGASFVIGIRMIGEWFPARQVGVAEGIYGGWGNFGSAAAALSLPTIALWYGGNDGWRYAIALTGAMALIYSVIYYLSVSDTPKGSTYFKPKKAGAMEVTSKGDFVLYAIMQAPLFATLALLAWKLGPAGLGMLASPLTALIYAALVAAYAYQVYKIYEVNEDIFISPVAKIHRYSFKQVAVLDLIYLVTFGSELAVISMLPLFYTDSFGVSLLAAGMLAAGYSFTNLIARPGGGLISDRYGRRKTLLFMLAGLTLGYLAMSQIGSSTPLVLAVVITMACSVFVQAGSGAVYAMVPIIKRRMTGQIAGMVGAYGNVGAVLFLTTLSFVSPQVFFLVIASAAVLTLGAVFMFLDEPSGQIAEVLPDGTVQMIDVS